MPHLILEASANIVEADMIIKECLVGCQNILVLKLPTQLSSCKSRFIKHEVYVAGDNTPANAFIHLDVRVFTGRSIDVLSNVIKDLQQYLSLSFAMSATKLNLEISVELKELSKHYTKTSV